MVQFPCLQQIWWLAAMRTVSSSSREMGAPPPFSKQVVGKRAPKIGPPFRINAPRSFSSASQLSLSLPRYLGWPSLLLGQFRIPNFEDLNHISSARTLCCQPLLCPSLTKSLTAPYHSTPIVHLCLHSITKMGLGGINGRSSTSFFLSVSVCTK